MSSTRRDFLKAALGGSTLVSLGPAVPAFLSRAALAQAPSPDAGDTVLVVVQLPGGNDGLNTVVPYDDDTYARNRPTLRLPADKVHKIDSHLGFHPRMHGFMRLFKEGHLSVVQGIGYANSTRDHVGAMHNWHTARPEEPNCQTGWLGRTIDRACRSEEAAVPGVFVGQTEQPFSLNAEQAVVPSIRSLRQCMLHTSPGPGGGQAYRRHLLGAAELPRTDADNPLLDFARRSTLSAYAVSRRIEEVARSGRQSSQYPAFGLAQTFRMVAQLIRAEMGIRIYHTEMGGGGIGGFDNHANQLGNHCAVLHQLSESVAAFLDDLERDKLLDRVLLMTFSEFGRTVAENGRRGTGHGAAAPMFLAGGKLKGGLVGPHPSLTDLDGGALKFHTDFRRVYATVLGQWLGFDSRAILGEQFEPLDLLQV